VRLPLLVVAGCGAHAEVAVKPKHLDGATIASRANAQLKKQNPHLAPGDLTCGNVKYEVGASARCARTVILADGRVVRIGATVTIDRTTNGGHFKIKVDDRPQECGITGQAVLADLAKQYAAKYGGTKPSGTCPPYLPGRTGASMGCSLDVRDGKLAVRVTVSRVDPRNYATGYTFSAVR